METKLLPLTVFSATELNEIYTVMNQPLVIKFIRYMGNVRMNDLAFSQRRIGETAESFLERRAAVQGELTMLETLLNMQPAADPVQNPS